jgi:hypothetical protein
MFTFFKFSFIDCALIPLLWLGLLNRLVCDFPSLTAKSKPLRTLLAHVVDLIKESLDQDV